MNGRVERRYRKGRGLNDKCQRNFEVSLKNKTILLLVLFWELGEGGGY